MNQSTDSIQSYKFPGTLYSIEEGRESEHDNTSIYVSLEDGDGCEDEAWSELNYVGENTHLHKSHYEFLSKTCLYSLICSAISATVSVTITILIIHL